MGFWDFAKKMVKGEPIYQAPVESQVAHDDWDDEPRMEPVKRQQSNSRLDSHGNKFLPEATIIFANYHVSSNGLIEVWAKIKNNSPYPLMMDKIILIGSTYELDYQLSPGNLREFKVYAGSALTNGAYDAADLYYRDDKGDYFCAHHRIEYKIDHAGKYIPKEFHLVRPVDDV